MSTTDRAELELVEQARAGDEGSLGMLATRVGERVRRYLNRVTLDEERSQDLTQETLVSVLESLGTLRQTERFWPWVFRIATNKARQHHRYEARRQALPMSSVSETHLPISRADGQGGLTQLSRKELGELTRLAMANVSDRYRMVLALRFFEDMPHSEIARALGCTELSARATFFRAKHALVRELRRRGVQSSALVAALAAFAELTAPPSASAAAVTVSAAAAAEGVITGLLSTKAKLAGGAIAALLAVALVWSGQGAARQSASAGGEPDVRFMHFAHQAADTGIAGGNSSQSRGCYEEWMHLPEGRGGPIHRRVQRWSPDQKNKQCWWVQNGDANYYVYAGEPSTIHVQDARLCSSSGLVTVLPTDPRPFCDFVKSIEGDRAQAMVDTSQIAYQRDQKTGLPKSRVDLRFPNLGPFETVYEYGPFDLKLFDAPAGLPVQDERDEMHKRGWTCFRIEGWLAGRPVSGTGRLPFVHHASKTHGPWLQLQMDGRPVAGDDGTHAWRLDEAGRVAQVYPGGALFRGLSRPWIGFHTLDTIRRDAAAERIWFSTTLFEWDKPADVTLVAQRGLQHCKLRYTVDMGRDTLQRIEIWSDEEGVFSQRTGDLRFVYLDKVDNLGNQFAEPPRLESPPTPAPAGGEATILWPIELLGGSRDGALGPPMALGRRG